MILDGIVISTDVQETCDVLDLRREAISLEWIIKRITLHTSRRELSICDLSDLKNLSIWIDNEFQLKTI